MEWLRARLLRWTVQSSRLTVREASTTRRAKVIVRLAWEEEGEASYSATRCTRHAAKSDLPLAFTVEPCDVNEKRCFQPLLKKLKAQGVSFKTIVADAQYDSEKARETAREYGAEPIIPYRKSSRIRGLEQVFIQACLSFSARGALKVGYDFVVHGVKRLVRLFRKRVCIERVFSRAKEWLLLDGLRVMLVVALTAVRQHQPCLIRSIKHYTAQ
jgi:hypothetical protein